MLKHAMHTLVFALIFQASASCQDHVSIAPGVPGYVTDAIDAAKAAQNAADQANAAAKVAADAAAKALDALGLKSTGSENDSGMQTALNQVLPELHLSKFEHFGRSFGVSVTMAEQPSQVQVGTDFVPTPQGFLTKGSLTLNPSEFFTTPSDISAEVTGFRDAGGHFDRTQKGGICHDDDAFVLARCLIRSRKRDVVYRALSGVSGTLSYSENLRVKNNVLITAGSDAASHNNQWSGSVAFSPSGIFLNGADWAAAQKAAAVFEGSWNTAYPVPTQNVKTTISRELLRVMVERCDSVQHDLYIPGGVDLQKMFRARCVKRLAGPTGTKAWAASLIPDFTYQLQTQFDFIKNGSTFVPYAGLQPSLWTVSTKWDLTKYLASGKNRLAALAAIVAALKQEKLDAAALGHPIDSQAVDAQVKLAR